MNKNIIDICSSRLQGHVSSSLEEINNSILMIMTIENHILLAFQAYNVETP